MHLLFTPDQIRAAEAPMLAACEAAGDPDRLMRQAAHGLVVHIARAVTRRPALGEPIVPAPTSVAEIYSGGIGAGTGYSPAAGYSPVSSLRGALIVGLIGPGNNGGDGLYALAGLARRGALCVAVMVADRWHERAAAAARDAGVELLVTQAGRPLVTVSERASRWQLFARAAQAAGVERVVTQAGGPLPVTLEEVEVWALLRKADVIVDAVLGIGAQGGMWIPGWDEETQKWAVVGDELKALVIAVDCPSGLNTLTGSADELVPSAHLTVTFGALKRGLVVGAGREKTGDVYLVEMGLKTWLSSGPMPLLVTPQEADAQLLGPRAGDHKYSRGVLGVLAGSPAYPGAAVLCSTAAAAVGQHDAGRGGVGMLVTAGRGETGASVVQALPEVVNVDRAELLSSAWPAAAQKATAWVVGPGIGTEPEDCEPAVAVMKNSQCPVVVDASALSLWEPESLLASRGDGTPIKAVYRDYVLTPHAGEFAALAQRLGVPTWDPLQDPLEAAYDLASAVNAVVLLKGSATVVAAPDGPVFVAASAAPTLARSGSGDKLAGVVGAMLATHAARALSSGIELSQDRIAELCAAAAVLHGVTYSIDS